MQGHWATYADDAISALSLLPVTRVAIYRFPQFQYDPGLIFLGDVAANQESGLAQIQNPTS
jgi:hypothetical protein